MNPILDIVRSGGVRALASLAAEQAGIVAKVARGSRRSLTSLAVAQLRREFPLLTQGTSGYETARAVWKRAVRAAESVARGRANPPPPSDGPGGVGGPRPPRAPRGGPGIYVYRVEFVSRNGVSRWRTVTYRGPAGLSDDQLASVAQAKLSDGPDLSPGQRYNRGYIAQGATAQTVVVLSFYRDD